MSVMVVANGDRMCGKKTFYSPQVQKKTAATVHPAFYHQVILLLFNYNSF
jgi:hypothetical protein